jgi:hypothetical protein
MCDFSTSGSPNHVGKIGELRGARLMSLLIARLLQEKTATANNSVFTNLCTAGRHHGGPTGCENVHEVADARAPFTIATNSATSREAPPTKAPSMSGWAMSDSTLLDLTEPPYWMRS